MNKSATEQGTQRFASRFADRAAEGHFRLAQGLTLSSIGLGTYLGQPDTATDLAYTEAVVAAVRGGVNVLDSAINYRFQRSERSIGAALKQLFAEGFAREELVICTKGGYLSPDGEMPRNPRGYFQREYFDRGICTPQDVAGGGHCMTPRYLEDQLARSLRNLGLDSVDIYYLHNPGESQLPEVPREGFLIRLRRAFEFLEAQVAAGRIRFYGLATWSSFRQDPRAPDYTSLEQIVKLAASVAGPGHHFRFVQLPFNLGMPEALLAGNQKHGDEYVPMVRAAAALGVTLVGSASLLQTRLRNLPPFVAEALGHPTDLLNALQFARSAPGITTALVGMSRTAHVAENLRLVSAPPATQDQFMRLFEKKP
jgi:aryl-alcohol dehydrogenase-like predicted oxidoreductase